MAFSVPPSGSWSGNDGNWSTFTILVGTPAKVLEVLPATLLQFTIVVLEEGCPPYEPGDCASLRGNLFNSSDLYSTSWRKVVENEQDTYVEMVFEAARPTLPEGQINGEMGITFLDMKGMDRGPLQNQLIAGIAAKEPFIGFLGLSAWPRAPVNETEYQTPLWGFRNRSTMTSLSWGYTAGARYYDSPVLGSLTLGGYDSSRVNMDEALSNVPFRKDYPGQDLSVTINAITFGDSAPEEVKQQVVLDSMVPDIWLPDEICTKFEQRFGLEWNSTEKMYLVNDTQHEKMKVQNISVAFDLTSDENEVEQITIRLPYSAFDHVAKWPLASIDDTTTSLYYFPLRRSGQNAVHFLGRTFFQEAYVSADYERRMFNVGQALLSPSSSPSLVTIHPVETDIAPYPEPNPDNALGAGAIAGISVGAFIVLSIFAALLWWRRRFRKRRDEAKQPPRMHRVLSADETTLAAADVEMTNMAEHNMTEHYKPAQELYGGPSDGAAEPYAKPELDTNTPAATRHELSGGGSTVRRPGHRRQLPSFGSSQSGISPMGAGDRMSGMFGEPSPPLNYSPRPSPPLPDRRHGAASPYAPFELP